MTDAVDRLGQRIADLEESLGNLMRYGIGLGRSSFEDGQIQQYTDGSLGGSFGTQFDGTNGAVALTSPIPPTPRWTTKWGPTVEEVTGGLKVRWEGYFEPNDFAIAPLGYKEVEIHVSDQSTLSGILFETLKTTITSARGGEVLIPLPYSDSGYYVRLTTRTTAGRASVPSAVVGPFFPKKVASTDLGFDIADLQGTTIFWGGTEPETDMMGDLWLKLPQEEAYRYGTTGWELVPDQESVVDALLQAIGDKIEDEQGEVGLSTGDVVALVASAQSAANSAGTIASAAEALAQTAKDTADGKIDVYRQDSEPTGGLYGLNDLWIDTNDGNRLYAREASSWVLADDQRIASALQTASGKTTVFAQDSAPSAAGRTAGDLWIETDNDNKQYVWNGSWTVRPLGAAAIAATARQLGAITTYRQTSAPASGMLVGDFWQDSDDGNKLYRFEGSTPTWTVVQDAAIQTAITNAATAQSTADGKMRTFIQASAPTGLTADDVGDLWIETDNDNVTYSWDLVTGTTYGWVKRQISTGAIKPNSLVASDVIATGTVSAALLQAVLVLATVIVAGDPAGQHARMSANGFETFAVDPGNGQQYQATWMGGPGADRWGGRGPNGMVNFQIDQDGRGTLRGLSVLEDPKFAGRPLSEWLAEVPRGIVASTYAVLNTPQVQWRYGLGEVSFISRKGRNYRAQVQVPHIYPNTGVNNARAIISLRYTTDGSAPTINSPMVESIFVEARTSQIAVSPPALTAHGTFTNVDGALVRLLACVEGFEGMIVNVNSFAPTDYYHKPFRMWVEDIGQDVPDTFIPNAGGGQLFNGSPPPPAPAAKTTQTVQWPAVWSRSYKQDGSLRTDTFDLYQGYGDSFNGRNAALTGFDSASIMSYLAGSTINTVEVYLHAAHWWNASGGTAQIGLHGLSGIPSTIGSHSFGAVGQYHFGRNEGAWFTLPSSLWEGWKTGAYKGLTFNAPDNSAVYYGRFTGDAPLIRITYTK